MRTLATLLLPLLIGCPTTAPEVPAGDQPGPNGEAPVPEPSAPEPDVHQAVPEHPNGVPPTFADLIEEGQDTVTLTVTITGAAEGMLEFHSSLGDGDAVQPIMVAREPFEGGTATIALPANYESPLHVGAFTSDSGTPDGAFMRGDLKDAVTVGAENISITIKMEEEARDPSMEPPPAPEPAPEAPADEAPADEAPAEVPAEEPAPE